MLKKVKERLKNSRLYRRLRFSKAWLAIFSRRTHRELKREANFYKNLFLEHQIDGLVFDIGANLGFTTQAFLDTGAERVIAVEPDSYNFAVLKVKFGHNSRVTIIPTAISAYEGKASLWLHQSDGALHTMETKWQKSVGSDKYPEKVTVKTITLDGLIEEYGIPTFVKIDVEGHEWKVLQGLHHPIPLISIEVNLPIFREEAIKCIQYLQSLYRKAFFRYAVNFYWESEWMNGADMVKELYYPSRISIELFCREHT